MRCTSPALLALVCAASLAPGCAKPRAAALPAEAPVPLLLPPPPPRVVEPYVEPEVPAATVERAASEASEPAARPAARPAAAPPVQPPPVAPRAPAEVALALRPGGEQKAESAIRALLARAARDLGRVDVSRLNADERVQHETARRFIQQSEAALAVGQLMYAGKLADKAASMAAVLVR